MKYGISVLPLLLSVCMFVISTTIAGAAAAVVQAAFLF